MGTLPSFILMIFHLYGLSSLVLSFTFGHTFGHFGSLVLVLLKIFSSFSPFTVSVKFKKGDQLFTYLILRASHPQILYIICQCSVVSIQQKGHQQDWQGMMQNSKIHFKPTHTHTHTHTHTQTNKTQKKKTPHPVSNFKEMLVELKLPALQD